MPNDPPPTLTTDELARIAATSLSRIEALTAHGILPAERNGTFEPSDVTRVRLAEALDQAGIPLDAIGRAIELGALSFDFVSDTIELGSPPTDRTVREQAELLGLPTEALIQIYAMWGLPQPGPDDPVRQDDRDVFAEWILLNQMVELDEATLARSAHLVGEAIRTIVRWAFGILEDKIAVPALEAGASRMDILRMAARMSPVTVPSVQRQLAWMYRREIEHETIQFIVETIESTIEAAGIVVPRQTVPPAIAFADLSDYTGLTERLGDAVAAEHADALAWHARRAVIEHRGRVVKQLGDGVMLHFADPADAVACGLALVERLSADDRPDAHVGIAAGPVVAREGDYFGRTVNLAARTLGQAQAGQVVVTREVADAAGTAFEFRPLGPALLKGIVDPVELFQASRTTDVRM